MASQTDIVNTALTLLGEGRVMSIDDDLKQARDAKAVYDIVLNSLLGGYTWSFAKTRAQLPALVGAPAFEFGSRFQLPADCMRLVMVGDVYVGVDLTDYRSMPSELYAIEGREILTDYGSPLNIKYIKRVVDTNLYPPNFVSVFAAKLAATLAESLTQSETKQARAEDRLAKELALAVRANAIELPPVKLPDDEWVMSRL